MIDIALVEIARFIVCDAFLARCDDDEIAFADEFGDRVLLKIFGALCWIDEMLQELFQMRICCELDFVETVQKPHDRNRVVDAADVGAIVSFGKSSEAQC